MFRTVLREVQGPRAGEGAVAVAVLPVTGQQNPGLVRGEEDGAGGRRPGKKDGPGLCHRQLVEKVSGLLPAGIMAGKQGKIPLVVPGFQQMAQLVDDDVLKQVPGLFHKFRVEADIAAPGGAASPFRFHFLHKKRVYRDAERFFPLPDERSEFFAEQGLVPVVHDAFPA